MTNNDIPPRPKLDDNDPRDAEEIERQLQASTVKQRIEDAKRRGVCREYEPEEKCW